MSVRLSQNSNFLLRQNFKSQEPPASKLVKIVKIKQNLLHNMKSTKEI